MRLSFALITAGLAIAVLLGAPLAWDGSYWLFKTLDLQIPYVSNERYSNILFEAPAAAAGRLTDNLPLLRILFGLPYAALPLLALAAAWWVVRDRAPGLILWAVLGIGLATLPGQLCFVCEGNISAQLFWPLYLAILVGLPRASFPVLGAVAPLLFFFHPVAIPLFVIAAATSLLVAVARREWRKRLMLFAVGLLVLAVLAALRLRAIATPYESSQLSLDIQALYFVKAVVGLPLAALLVSWLSGLLFLLSRHFAGHPTKKLLRNGALWGLALSGLLLVAWAVQPLAWKDALLFKTFAVLGAGPFMLYALLDIMAGRRRGLLHRVDPSYERVAIVLVSLAYVAVLTIQSVLFSGMTSSVLADIRSSEAPCIARSSLTTFQGTALEHWSLTALVLDHQSRTPEHILLDTEKACLEAAAPGPIQLVTWETQGDGWFNLRDARARIDVAGDCVVTFSRGFHWVEGTDTDWWVWMWGRGKVLVFVRREEEGSLLGGLTSIQGPNTVNLWLNDDALPPVTVDAGVFQPLGPFPLRLTPGVNNILFESDAPGAFVQDRSLVLAVHNLRVVLDSGTECRIVR